MVNQLKYIIGGILSIPILPLMYFQGKSIKKNIPKLPAAKGVQGMEGNAVKQLNLLTLGESTMAGVGVDTHKNGFTGALAQEIATQGYTVNWKVVAESGYSAAKVKNILLPKITNFQPDLIVIGLGGNDAFELNSPLRWRKDMKGILSQLKDIFPNAIIVCTNMPPIKEFPAFTKTIQLVIGNLVELLGDELNDLIKDFDRVFYDEKQLEVNEWLNAFDEPKTVYDFFSDGVHPSPLTYQTWGQQIGKYIFEYQFLNKS